MALLLCTMWLPKIRYLHIHMEHSRIFKLLPLGKHMLQVKSKDTVLKITNSIAISLKNLHHPH